MLPSPGILKGRKTYIIALVGIITAVGAWLSGDMTTPGLIEAVFAALAAMSLRAGIAKAEPLLMVALLFFAGCASAPVSTQQPQTGKQRTGQGDSQVAAAAGNAQAGVGAKPNRQGAQGVEKDGVVVTTPSLDREGNVVVDKDGAVVMTTVRGRGLRDLYIGSEINNDANAQISGTTTDTAQTQSGAPVATSSPRADNTTTTEADIKLVP